MNYNSNVDVNVLLSAAAESDECPNVILADDRKLILTGGLPVLEKIMPNATVTDFEASDNNEPHIALNNIRERFDMMCGGALAISVREGGGTAVKVTIPLTQTE